MLIDAALGFLNHLLSDEDWARERLKPFAGQTVRLELGVQHFPLDITAGGYFSRADTRANANVCLTLPADTLMRVLTDRPSLLAATQISGSADLAECLGFVFRNLSWDVENDLSPLVGDIAARRLVAGGRQLFQWQRQQAQNLARNLAEYFTEESPSLARRQDIAALSTDVNHLLEPLTRVEQRIATLESQALKDTTL